MVINAYCVCICIYMYYNITSMYMYMSKLINFFNIIEGADKNNDRCIINEI